MANEFAYESWVDSETFIDGQFVGSSWDQVKLGDVYLPGVCTIDDFEYGNDIDVQKRKKREGATISDNGLAPCAFNILVEINASQWHEWLSVRPHIQPKEGATRQPLAITHPLVNSCNVRDVYVHKIKISPPSARDGMKITIRVAQWFPQDEEKSTKQVEEVKDAPPRPKPLIAGAGAGNRIANLGEASNPSDGMAERSLD